MPPKKVEVKPTSMLSHPDPFVEIVFFIFTILVSIYLINGLVLIFNKIQFSPFAGLITVASFLTSNSFEVWMLRIFLIFLSVLCVFGIIYIWKKLKFLRENERKLLYPDGHTITSATNPQWEKILSHIESVNENDWRQAILEADIMLSMLLDKLYLPGETMGDKLKVIERSDFTTIDNAWEAHKIRNQIAHEGSKFMLNQREARNVISMYESVFKEFKII